MLIAYFLYAQSLPLSNKTLWVNVHVRCKDTYNFNQIPGLHKWGKLSESYSLKQIFSLFIISVVRTSLWIWADFRRWEGIRGGIPLFLPWAVYYIHDIFLQHISLCFSSDLSFPPFVLYIDHIIKPQIFHNKEYIPLKAIVEHLLTIIVQILSLYTRPSLPFLNYCVVCLHFVPVLWDVPAIMVHAGDFTLGVTARIQYQKRCDNENLNVQCRAIIPKVAVNLGQGT